MKKLQKSALAIFPFILALLGNSAIAQSGAIMGPLVWNTIPAGTYKIKPQSNDNLCLTRKLGGWIGREAFLNLETCGAFYQQGLSLIPTAFENGIVKFRITNYNNCATVARGVVFGSPSIDMRNCDGAGQSNPNFNAAPDQKFTIERSGAAIIIKTANNKCLAVQGANFNVGTQIIEENCNNSAAQRFSALGDNDALNINDVSALRAFGWVKVANFNTETMSGSNLYRKMPSLNLPSADYNWFATANDEGEACATACVADAACKGFTWVNPAMRNGQAWCYLKNAINTPIADNFTMSGFVRN